MKALPLFSVACLMLTGCGYLAEHTAKTKSAGTTRTQAALAADELFWATFHGGKYEEIQPALEAETAAYLADPHDPVAASHVAWLHIWRLSERARLASVPASITDDALLARGYFEEALAMRPREARYRGFLASATLVEGKLNQNERQTRRGYYMLLDAINAWPEFNLFTAGYVMSAQPPDSARFKQALALQWRDIDVCVSGKVDRKDPDFAPYMRLETHEGPKRACWNSWIAPHNFEGFFLNMGDMLVKSGDPETARKIYTIAKLSPAYGEWPFRQVLEDHLRDAPGNVAAFNAQAAGGGDRPRMMFDSAINCVACHQK
jgi:uncharacterized protein YceK